MTGPVRSCSRSVEADVWTWDGRVNERLTEWLGSSYVSHDMDVLTVRTPDSDAVRVLPGWTLIRWGDGTVSVWSPSVVDRIWRSAG